MFDYLDDDASMRAVTDEFARGSSTGMMSSIVGALNGWLIKIHYPSEMMNSIKTLLIF